MELEMFGAAGRKTKTLYKLLPARMWWNWKTKKMQLINNSLLFRFWRTKIYSAKTLLAFPSPIPKKPTLTSSVINFFFQRTTFSVLLDGALERLHARVHTIWERLLWVTWWLIKITQANPVITLMDWLISSFVWPS